MDIKERDAIKKEVTNTLLNKQPARVKQLYKLAVREGLNDPFGRACFAASRYQNDSVHDPLALMKRAKPETAERWRLHYQNGGSLKSLKKFRKEDK